MKMIKFCSLYAACALVAVLGLTACGSSSDPAVNSTRLPSVFNSHVAALRNGVVHAWGFNGYGQLGNNGSANSSVPVAVPGLAGVSGVSAGGTHTIAFKNLSSVWGWGNNGYGQVGDNTLSARTLPVRVVRDGSGTPLSGIVAVAAGGNHSLALDSTHVIWAWGGNYSGQLGDATTSDRALAVKVSNIPSTVTMVAAGGSHSLALLGDGTVMAWGYNSSGQLGNGTTSSTPTTVPVTVQTESGAALGNVIAIAAGGSHSLAVDRDGAVWAWGYNLLGQLGTGDKTDRHQAVKVGSLPGPLLNAPGTMPVAAGLDHSLVVLRDGSVMGWGFNYYGQLGNGSLKSIEAVTIPVQVKLPDGTPLTGVTRVEASGHQSIGHGAGTLWMWGDNTFGQLGIGTTESSGFARTVTL